MIDMPGITQGSLPHTPWTDPALSRMPGMRPVEGSWIVVDDAYAAQMSERDRLLRGARETVLAILPEAREAAEELREVALAALPEGFAREGGHVVTPDRRRVAIDGPPFDVLNALLQEDLALLDRRGEEHVLVAGLICFPSHWTLAQKIGRPLTRIHRPIPSYDGDVAMRVQRLFDRIPAGRAMWRANVLPHGEARLHRPMPEGSPPTDPAKARFVRSERQTLLRLPRTGAVLFAIHTWIVPLDRLTTEQTEGLPFG